LSKAASAELKNQDLSCSYVNKPGYMLETPWILEYSPVKRQ